MRFALLTCGVLPATLDWLIAACLLKAWLNWLPAPMQSLLGTSLGAASGLYGCSLLTFMGLLALAPFLAVMATGALMAAIVMAGLSGSRASGHTFYSTPSTVRLPWCAPSRRRPKPCWKIWPSCFAARWRTRPSRSRWGRKSSLHSVSWRSSRCVLVSGYV